MVGAGAESGGGCSAAPAEGSSSIHSGWWTSATNRSRRACSVTSPGKAPKATGDQLHASTIGLLERANRWIR